MLMSTGSLFLLPPGILPVGNSPLPLADLFHDASAAYFQSKHSPSLRWPPSTSRIHFRPASAMSLAVRLCSSPHPNGSLKAWLVPPHPHHMVVAVTRNGPGPLLQSGVCPKAGNRQVSNRRPTDGRLDLEVRRETNDKRLRHLF